MELYENLRSVKAFVFDVDGVMTDSLVHVWENGDLTRTMNTRDGFALKRAIDNGYKVGVITGGKSQGVISRLHALGVMDVYSSVTNKVSTLQVFIDKYNLSYAEVIYMGDDIMDLTVMNLVGIPAAPADAIPEILNISKFISTKEGGRGCVREIIEQTMKLQNTWAMAHEGEVPGV